MIGVVMKSNAAFSLIELLVVVAIIGILAAVGIIGYEAYIDNTKREAALTNATQVNRAIEQDVLSLANDLGGTTELGNKLVVNGVTLSTNVGNNSSCFKYAENVKQYLNDKWKNAYDTTADYAVNLHFSHHAAGTGVSLKAGQIGIQCANVCAGMKGNFYLHTCSCTGGEDCDLFDFSKANYDTFIADPNCPGASCQYALGDAPKDAYDYVQHQATQNLVAAGKAIWSGVSSDAASARKVVVGDHMPGWLCPKPITGMPLSSTGCTCDNPNDGVNFPCN
jgi:prepilin-type N-terminal cleavage/methylation domain-containing protein